MTDHSKPNFFPTLRAGVLASLAVITLLAPGVAAFAQQDTAPAAAAPTPAAQSDATPAATPSPATTAPAEAQAAQTPPAVPQVSGPIASDPTVTALPQNGTGRQKEKLTKAEKKADKVVQSKDTRRALTREKKLDPLAGQDAKLPDRQLYDKALLATKKGRFDVARLDLQTLLNTYPDSQYLMRAKLAIADSWYKEGGTASLTQAEAEYHDFVIFFPNAPEAAEAQMRIGDIYFRQMDKPDRDSSKAVHAQEEYRRMLTDYPDSKLTPQAKQRLREVQEAMATREASIGDYYASHENWPATIARYQTVVQTYPLYSHMDDVLIGLGDAFEAEARFVRSQKMPEDGKARLEKVYDTRAADCYRAVVLEHSAAPHVEDARDRLAAMNLPIPTPTVERAQASQALENSRAQYRLQDRARLLFLHQPDVVNTARLGEPPLTDPKVVVAPAITKQIINDFNEAMHPGSTAPGASATAANDGSADPAATPGTPAAAPAPLALQDVPNADGSAASTAGSVTTATPATGNGAGAALGAEILTPGVNGSSARTGGANGISAVGSNGNAALPPIEHADGAPDQVNDIQPGALQPTAQNAPANGKKAKSPGYDKGDESSSKHKKKKGVDKLNPF